MKDKIRKVLRELYKEEPLLDIEKVDTYQNEVYKLKTGKGNFFMKVFTEKAEEYICEKLASLYKLLATNNIPVPQVNHYDLSSSIIGFPFIILSEAEGKMLQDTRPSDASFLKILVAL